MGTRLESVDRFFEEECILGQERKERQIHCKVQEVLLKEVEEMVDLRDGEQSKLYRAGIKLGRMYREQWRKL